MGGASRRTARVRVVEASRLATSRAAAVRRIASPRQASSGSIGHGRRALALATGHAHGARQMRNLDLNRWDMSARQKLIYRLTLA
jgi:fructose/tagatose bisphosphate aldolase